MSVSYKIYLTIPQQFSKVYTLIGHSNDVNIFITQEETRRAAGEWFHCKVLNILRQFYRQVVYNPEKIVVDLYFTTFSVFDAHCHHVTLRFFFWKSSRASTNKYLHHHIISMACTFCPSYMFIALNQSAREKSLRHFKMCFVSGFPFTIVGMTFIVTFIVTGIEKYVAENCWLTLEHNILYCAFVAPAAMIVLVSILS